jgi:phytoene synthase
LASTLTAQEKSEHLRHWGQGVLADLREGKSKDAIGMALADTVSRFNIPIELFESFLHSMTMDLTVTEYQNFEDLMEYVYGSACVIGLQMVPILGALSQDAYPMAEKLGAAFQLANFIRDVGEDLDRGRIYLPINELAAHGVTWEMLNERVVTSQIRSALKEQIERVRKLQREANQGIKLLEPSSRPCIEAASELYCGIVDEVEKIDYQIFTKRAKTSQLRRLSVALPALARAISAR